MAELQQKPTANSECQHIVGIKLWHSPYLYFGRIITRTGHEEEFRPTWWQRNDAGQEAIIPIWVLLWDQELCCDELTFAIKSMVGIDVLSSELFSIPKVS